MAKTVICRFFMGKLHLVKQKKLCGQLSFLYKMRQKSCKTPDFLRIIGKSNKTCTVVM